MIHDLVVLNDGKKQEQNGKYKNEVYSDAEQEALQILPDCKRP
jgi:hypothetical protein